MKPLTRSAGTADLLESCAPDPVPVLHMTWQLHGESLVAEWLPANTDPAANSAANSATNPAANPNPAPAADPSPEADAPRARGPHRRGSLWSTRCRG